MAKIDDNEFPSSPVGNEIRPFTSGTIRHQENISTIVVYKEDDDPVESGDPVNYNDLTKTVSTISPEQTTQSVDASSVSRDKNGSAKPVSLRLDGKHDYYGVFNNFSLLNVQESTDQIVKMHVNFGANWNAFFFGEQPRVYSFSGVFIDTMDYPYFQEFIIAYDKYLSGRKAVENKIKTKIVYDGRVVDGYILNIRTATTAGNQMMKEFTFTVLVKNVQWIRNNLIPSISSTDGSSSMIEYPNGLLNTHRFNNIT